MFLAKVTGSVVSTHKVAAMTGSKLLTVQPIRVVELEITAGLTELPAQMLTQFDVTS